MDTDNKICQISKEMGVLDCTFLEAWSKQKKHVHNKKLQSKMHVLPNATYNLAFYDAQATQTHCVPNTMSTKKDEWNTKDNVSDIIIKTGSIEGIKTGIKGLRYVKDWKGWGPALPPP